MTNWIDPYFTKCAICDRTKPVCTVELERIAHDNLYKNPEHVCRKCLWLYAYFYQLGYDNIMARCEEQVRKRNVVTPDIIAVDSEAKSNTCAYSELLRHSALPKELYPRTYLDLLPADMYTQMLSHYICSSKTCAIVNTFRLSMTAPVLDCTDGARPYTCGTIIIRGKSYCYQHMSKIYPN